MRIVIMAVGSRGDVASYTGLGVRPAAALTEAVGNSEYRRRAGTVAGRLAAGGVRERLDLL